MTIPDQQELEILAERLGKLLLAEKLQLTTAESCTGGWVAQCITAIAGSSEWFDRGFVTYSNQAKQEMLGVAAETLAAHGAVSQQVAVAMAQGALGRSGADLAVAVTGIAGPSGGSEEKPVGTVCFAWASRAGWTETETCRFAGNRRAVRAQSAAYALTGSIERLRSPSGGLLA